MDAVTYYVVKLLVGGLLLAGTCAFPVYLCKFNSWKQTIAIISLFSLGLPLTLWWVFPSCLWAPGLKSCPPFRYITKEADQ